jgi:hypothetical protein
MTCESPLEFLERPQRCGNLARAPCALDDIEAPIALLVLQHECPVRQFAEIDLQESGDIVAGAQ